MTTTKTIKLFYTKEAKRVHELEEQAARIPELLRFVSYLLKRIEELKEEKNRCIKD